MALSRDGYLAISSYCRVLSRALDEKDATTRRHCDRVVGLCEAFGRYCKLGAGDLHQLRLAAVLHDIGKIGIPDCVLLKPGAFDDDEWREMQSHAERGERIVQAIALDGAGAVAHVVRHHHESFDGSGYPDGLRGEAVPYASRMVALADAYDAMAGLRPYQQRRSHKQIMEILAAESGARFDPYLLARFAAMIHDSGWRAGLA